MRYLMVVLAMVVCMGCATVRTDCPPCKSVVCDFDNKVMKIDGVVYK